MVVDPDLEENIPELTCASCNSLLKEESRYCSFCGSSQVSAILLQHTNAKINKLKQVGIFYGLEIILCLGYTFTESYQTLTGLTVFHVLSAINALFFLIFNKHHSLNTLLLRNFSCKKLIIYVLLTIPASLLVSYLASKINFILYSANFSYYQFFKNYSYGKTLMLLYIAILPAIFEELAYRGYLLQALKDVVDEKQAMFISAFLFAIIHISFISLVWMIPLALVLAYICVKENSIWYGVAIHFTFNLTACVLELI